MVGGGVEKGGRRNINPSPSQHACRRKLQTYYSPLISLNEGGLSRRASLRDGDEVRRVNEACTGWEGKGEGGGGARYLPVVCRQTVIYIYLLLTQPLDVRVQTVHTADQPSHIDKWSEDEQVLG